MPKITTNKKPKKQNKAGTTMDELVQAVLHFTFEITYLSNGN